LNQEVAELAPKHAFAETGLTAIDRQQHEPAIGRDAGNTPRVQHRGLAIGHRARRVPSVGECALAAAHRIVERHGRRDGRRGRRLHRLAEDLRDVVFGDVEHGPRAVVAVEWRIDVACEATTPRLSKFAPAADDRKDDALILICALTDVTNDRTVRGVFSPRVAPLPGEINNRIPGCVRSISRM